MIERIIQGFSTTARARLEDMARRNGRSLEDEVRAALFSAVGAFLANEPLSPREIGNLARAMGDTATMPPPPRLRGGMALEFL